MSCDAEGPGDFSLCLARFGNMAEKLLELLWHAVPSL